MMELAEHNAKMYESQHGVPLRMPAPEFGPDAEWIITVGSPNTVYEPSLEYAARMRRFDYSVRFWQRVEMQSMGWLTDMLGPGDEPGGTLVIPWAMLTDRDRWR
jgi:hypothetical protein